MTPANDQDGSWNAGDQGKDEIRRRRGGRRASLTPVDLAGERTSGSPRRAQASPKPASRRRVVDASGHAGPLHPASRIDSGRAGLLPYAPPVADWLRFLGELLAAEYLREMNGQDTAP
jgi:hypothetical protein